MGVYLYTYATDAAYAKQEAQALLKLLAGRTLELGVFYDMETSSLRTASAAAVQAVANAFRDEITAAGYACGIYCDASFYATNNHFKGWAPGCEFWIAAYGSNDGAQHAVPKIDHHLIAHQYSSKGRVSGISGDVDVDAWYGQAAAKATMTVKQRQCLLEYMGYSPGVIDGEDGKNTQKAKAAFEKDYGAGASLLDAVNGVIEKLREPQKADVKNETGTGTTGTFWDEIEFFTREECKCKCGGKYCNGYPAEMQEAVVRIADAARKHFGRPGHIVSGLRCKQWNAHEDGAWNSQHMYGEAIDLRIDGVTAAQLRAFVSSQPNHRYSYCINGTNVHFDIPPVGR